MFEGRVEEAFRLYAVPNYRQHNPLIEDGMEGVKKFVTWVASPTTYQTLRSAAGCMVYARELLGYDFKETERLETRIARQTRHCVELKAREEIRSKT